LRPPGPRTMSTSDRPASPPEIDERQVDAALDAIARSSLGPTAVGRASLFALFAVAHLFTLPEGVRLVMSLLAALTAALLGTLGYALRRGALAARHAHSVGAGVALVVLANCLVHLYLTADLAQTTNLLLLLVGGGSLFA